MSPKVTIVLVDDHAVVRAGVRRLLEQETLFEVIGEADDHRHRTGQEGHHAAAEGAADVLGRGHGDDDRDVDLAPEDDAAFRWR